jgi:hypothetical protein
MILLHLNNNVKEKHMKQKQKKLSKFDKQILNLLSYYHKNYDVFGNQIIRGKKNATSKI